MKENLNGDTVLANVPRPVNRQLVQLLEAALADAKAGNIMGAALIIAIGPGSFVPMVADGGQSGAILAGATMLQHDMVDRMRQPRQSPIMRAGAGAMPRG
jgi:hypothetical protein